VCARQRGASVLSWRSLTITHRSVWAQPAPVLARMSAGGGRGLSRNGAYEYIFPDLANTNTIMPIYAIIFTVTFVRAVQRFSPGMQIARRLHCEATSLSILVTSTRSAAALTAFALTFISCMCIAVTQQLHPRQRISRTSITIAVSAAAMAARLVNSSALRPKHRAVESVDTPLREW